jgi:hypothetical protein
MGKFVRATWFSANQPFILNKSFYSFLLEKIRKTQTEWKEEGHYYLFCRESEGDNNIMRKKKTCVESESRVVNT